MPLSVDTLSLISYSVGFLGFAGFSLQLALRPRSGHRARALLVATVASALWELTGAAFSVWPKASVWLSYLSADALRFGFWIWFLAALLPERAVVAATAAARIRTLLAGGTAAILLGAGVAAFLSAYPSGALAGGQTGLMFGLWVGASILGLVLCEQIFRHTPEERRWAVKPLCLGVSAVFGFDLFMFSDALLLRALNHDFWSVRGVAHALTIPLVILATVRNRDWTIDVGMSRRTVFHSTALLLSGLYLLAVAGAGYYVRYFGGDWGRAIQTAFLFAAFLLLALLFSSGTIRARLRVFVSKHFFSYRYDYREEWLRFTSMLATTSGDLTIAQRTIKALADLVESPAGVLWLRGDDGVFRLAGAWNLAESAYAEPPGVSLVNFLTRSGWVIDVAEQAERPYQYPELQPPSWLKTNPDAWLIIPLPSSEVLVAFVLLARPRTAVEVNWEVRDLLKTAARQAATFLGHVQATEALVQAKQFDAFNRMSAFVVHDLKNLVAQLSLMLRNAEQHAAKPEFQQDMRATIQHVVARMNRLLLQLRSGTAPVENRRSIDLLPLTREVQEEQAKLGRRINLEVEPGVRALGHEERLKRVIGHLVQNALDATAPDGEVSIRVYWDGAQTTLEIEDTGVGMTPDFIREQLFKPFRSTKPAGMGIGAYESHQYVLELGGRIEVDSSPGAGTRVRVRLPSVDSEAAMPEPQQEVI